MKNTLISYTDIKKQLKQNFNTDEIKNLLNNFIFDFLDENLKDKINDDYFEILIEKLLNDDDLIKDFKNTFILYK